ncbi:uncharacterized protein H6S33_008705 [Morchella sextelata]|uniref:uncharacterized protein n=1 Tax=Morchella sextelata TaxID=1174677 RepID=UPI001D052A22|nr:uncharacterized protein H6S33_008705 [Morchella sextelata]KAH0602366.1 hypothetical protein H6S33_008705 [Morchella sextelata]
MTLTACDNATIKDVFRKISGIKAAAERFCSASYQLGNGVLVKGSPVSYQNAIDNGIIVNDLGSKICWGSRFTQRFSKSARRETDDSRYSSNEWCMIKMGEVSMKNIHEGVIGCVNGSII